MENVDIFISRIENLGHYLLQADFDSINSRIYSYMEFILSSPLCFNFNVFFDTKIEFYDLDSCCSEDDDFSEICSKRNIHNCVSAANFPDNIFYQISYVLKMFKFYFFNRYMDINEFINKIFPYEYYKCGVKNFIDFFIYPVITEINFILKSCYSCFSNLLDSNFREFIEKYYLFKECVLYEFLPNKDIVSKKDFFHSFFNEEISRSELDYFNEEIDSFILNHNLMIPNTEKVKKFLDEIYKKLDKRGLKAILKISNNIRINEMIYSYFA